MFKTTNNGRLPTRATKYSACVDLYANKDVTIGAGETKIIGLGVKIDLDKLLYRVYKEAFTKQQIYKQNNYHKKVEELHDSFKNSHYILLEPRSSLRAKGLIVGSGIIDLDYNSELKLIIHYPYNGKGASHYEINSGDRIAQCTLLEHKSHLFGIESEDTRSGGIGSTDEQN